MSVVTVYLWSADNLIWQDALPWQFVNYLAYTLTVSPVSYYWAGFNISFLRPIRTFIVSTANYTITGFNVNILRPIRNLIVSTQRYLITQFPVIFRGIGSWIWSNRAKPTDAAFTNRAKPTDAAFTNRAKPTDSIWTNRFKF